jgi:PleD family two-component response regulator
MTGPVVSPSATEQEAWRILLVDDEPTQRLIMARLLKRAGYSVEAAGNGKEALDKIAAGDFQLMITDWEMPEMDGIALCRELRATPGKGYIYTILLTARDAIEHVVTGLQSGADDYLTKPVIEPELMARLSTGKRIVTLERSLRTANEENRRLSITDPLTGAYNRRYLTEQLPREMERAARYGGEEFLIVLPETNVANAAVAAEHLRAQVAATPFPGVAGGLAVTASFGVAGWQGNVPQGSTFDALVARCDEGVYASKAAGRNCVTARPMD